MSFIALLGSVWPIAVVAMPIILGTGFLWLKDKFPTKADLTAAKDELTNKIAGTEQALSDKIDEHEQRLDDGSKVMSGLDKRTALVEEECRQMPSRQTLQVELSNLGQRMRGVEVRTEAIGEHLKTQNDYLHTLIERGLGTSK